MFLGWMVVSKRLDPGSSKLARDDTALGSGGLVSGNLFTISPFHLKNTFTPSPRQHVTTTPQVS
jgi:hypothetical protein